MGFSYLFNGNSYTWEDRVILENDPCFLYVAVTCYQCAYSPDSTQHHQIKRPKIVRQQIKMPRMVREQVKVRWCRMMTSWNENNFRVTGPLWGKPPVTGGFPLQRLVTRCFIFFFDQRLNKRFIKQSTCQWFEIPSPSLWRHCNAVLLWFSWALSQYKDGHYKYGFPL